MIFRGSLGPLSLLDLLTQPALTCMHVSKGKQSSKETGRCEICSKWTIKTPERRQWLRYIYLYCQLWTDFTHYSVVFIIDFEQVNAGWEFFYCIKTRLGQGLLENFVKSSKFNEVGDVSLLFCPISIVN